MFKVRSTQMLATKAETDTLLNEPFDLSQLFRPETMLNALRQLSARYN